MSFAIPDKVAHVSSGGADDEPLRVYLLPLPDGPALILEDTAALIWLVAAEGAADVPAEVAAVLAEPVEKHAGDVRAFLAKLVAQGLLDEGSPTR